MASPYTPIISFNPPATVAERAKFAVAIPDSKNKGVFDKNGNRKAPRFNQHVDDNMYREYLGTSAKSRRRKHYQLIQNLRIPR